jgi:hypothetical protein
MGRRLDFNKAFRNEQARYGLSVKDEAEWMENDTATQWLRRRSRRASRLVDHQPSLQRCRSHGMELPVRKRLNRRRHQVSTKACKVCL